MGEAQALQADWHGLQNGPRFVLPWRHRASSQLYSAIGTHHGRLRDPQLLWELGRKSDQNLQVLGHRYRRSVCSGGRCRRCRAPHTNIWFTLTNDASCLSDSLRCKLGMSDDEDAREFERLQNEVRELKALAAQPWSRASADHAEEEGACSSGYEDDDLEGDELDDEEEGQPRPTEPMQASGNVGWPPVHRAPPCLFLPCAHVSAH